ncbi:MAG: FAD-dependent oxidoreductase [Planctomycetota bacterium]|nr:FAD-dependent oxidoreductase [Planctomycetota bacterium]
MTAMPRDVHPGGFPLWAARSTPLALPVLEEEARADVCVVGLGGSGLTAIHALLDSGLDVVGLDAGPVASGAAGRNGGLLLAGLAPFFHDAAEALGAPRATALHRATMDEQERVVAASAAYVRRTGSLRIAADDAEAEDCAAQLDAMRAAGLPVERYQGPWGRGLLFPTDLAFHPLGRALGLATDARGRGARLFERSPAVEVRADAVRTDRGAVRADHVIVATAGGLARLVPELAPRVRTARLQMLGTAPARDVELAVPMYLRHGYEYAQQLPGGEIALGGFRDHHEDEEWTDSTDPTAAIQGLLDSFLRDRIGTTAAVTHRWAASVGYVDGPLPVVEELERGVFALGGYSGTGNLVGALAGRAAAEWAAGAPGPFTELFSA